MKLIIAGGRDLSVDLAIIDDALRFFNLDMPTLVISGACGLEDEHDPNYAKGIDGDGERWADHYGIPRKRYPAPWRKQGLAAGPSRNAEMAHVGDQLLLIWNGLSTGSANMGKQMHRRKKPIYELILRSRNVPHGGLQRQLL